MNFQLEKKNLHEIANIFREQAKYEVDDMKKHQKISFQQQEKINRLLSQHKKYMNDYLIIDDVHQQNDYFRILSKQIQVIDFEKAQRFQKSHFDGMYIILKGSLDEVSIESVTENQKLQSKPVLNTSREKKKDQARISSMFNMCFNYQTPKKETGVQGRVSIQELQLNANDILSESSSDSGSPNNLSSENILLSDKSLDKPKKSLNTLNFLNLQIPQASESPRNSLNNSPLYSQSKSSVTSIILRNSLRNEFKRDSQIKHIQKNANITAFAEGEEDDEQVTPLLQRQNYVKDQKLLHSFQLNLKKLKIDSKQQDEIMDTVPEIIQVPLSNTYKQPFLDIQQNKFISPDSSPLKKSTPGRTIQPHLPISQVQSMRKLSFLAGLPQSAQFYGGKLVVINFGESFTVTKVNYQEKRFVANSIEGCTCLRITKKNMEHAFKEQLQQLQFKIQVLEKIFQNVPSSKIIKLAYHFQEQTQFKGQPIYCQGDYRPFSVYIIKSGEVQIVLDLDQIEHNKPQLPNEKNIDKDSLVELNLLKSQHLLVKGNSRNFIQKPNIMGKGINGNCQVLCTMSEQEIFGTEDIIDFKDRRSMSALVSSHNAEFYILPESYFSHLYNSESSSIQSWYMQKQLFYSNQQNLLQRIQTAKQKKLSLNHQILPKHLKKQFQYLFQEDESTFKNRLKILQQENILTLKHFSEYKDYRIPSEDVKMNSLKASLHQGDTNVSLKSPNGALQTDKKSEQQQIQLKAAPNIRFNQTTSRNTSPVANIPTTANIQSMSGNSKIILNKHLEEAFKYEQNQNQTKIENKKVIHINLKKNTINQLSQPSLVYISKSSRDQCHTTKKTNIGQIQSMIKENGNIFRNQFHFKKRKDYAFQSPMFDELKAENLISVQKLIQQKSLINQKPSLSSQQQESLQPPKNDSLDKYRKLIERISTESRTLASPKKNQTIKNSYFFSNSPQQFISQASSPLNSITYLNNHTVLETTNKTLNMHMDRKRSIEKKQIEPSFNRTLSSFSGRQTALKQNKTERMIQFARKIIIKNANYQKERPIFTPSQLFQPILKSFHVSPINSSRTYKSYISAAPFH